MQEIQQAVDCTHIVRATTEAPALCISNENGPIVEIWRNADVIIHQEGNLPEAAHRLYAELRRIGAMPIPSITDERLREIAAKASVAAAKNASTVPQLLFADIYFTLQEELQGVRTEAAPSMPAENKETSNVKERLIEAEKLLEVCLTKLWRWPFVVARIKTFLHIAPNDNSRKNEADE